MRQYSTAKNTWFLQEFIYVESFEKGNNAQAENRIEDIELETV